jgi:hypothetical protein
VLVQSVNVTVKSKKIGEKPLISETGAGSGINQIRIYCSMSADKEAILPCYFPIFYMSGPHGIKMIEYLFSTVRHGLGG